MSMRQYCHITTDMPGWPYFTDKGRWDRLILLITSDSPKCRLWQSSNTMIHSSSSNRHTNVDYAIFGLEQVADILHGVIFIINSDIPKRPIKYHYLCIPAQCWLVQHDLDLIYWGITDSDFIISWFLVAAELKFLSMTYLSLPVVHTIIL